MTAEDHGQEKTDDPHVENNNNNNELDDDPFTATHEEIGERVVHERCKMMIDR